jgi:MarR family transcriptional regulator, organic hydroperoxide resistance regulator
MVRELKGRMSGAGRKKTSRASVEIDFGMLNDLIGFNLRMAQNTMHRHYAKTAARLGVGQRQFAVLELIDSNPGVSQVDIAAALGLDRPAMMVVVDRLESRKLAIRKRSETDRRRQELHLTPKGIKFLEKVRALVREHEEMFSSLFTERETARLNAFLRRIAGAKEKTRRSEPLV